MALKEIRINKEITSATEASIQPLIKNLMTAKKTLKEPNSREEKINKLIIDNATFVVSIANYYINRISKRVPAEDVLQNGMIGLITAANKYDETLGYTFTTYAVNWIQQSIMEGLSKDKLIHIPFNKYQQDCKSKKELAKQAAELEVETVSLDTMPTYDIPLVSTDEIIENHGDRDNSGSVTRGDKIGTWDPEYYKDIIGVVYKYINSLHFGRERNTDRMRDIIITYIKETLNDISETSIKEELAYKYNMTEERTRQLLEKSKVFLRTDPYLKKLVLAS